MAQPKNTSNKSRQILAIVELDFYEKKVRNTYYASHALCYEMNFTWTFLWQQKINIESKVEM